MDELISRSLARRHAPSKEDQYEAYSVHDLQLDFLKETCTLTAGNKDLSQRHKVSVYSLTTKRAKENNLLLRFQNKSHTGLISTDDFNFSERFGSVSSSIPCTCHLLVGFCCYHFRSPWKWRQ